LAQVQYIITPLTLGLTNLSGLSVRGSL